LLQYRSLAFNKGRRRANGELGQFVWIAAATVVIAVPIILKTIRLPRLLELQLIPDSQLTPKQREFFASYDSKLKQLGFEPFATYRMSNIPKSKNLLRTYLSSTEPTRATVQISAACNGPIPFDQVHFVTEFADKSRTFTTNRLNSETFDREPDKFVLECRALTDLAELKRRHEQFAEQYRIRGPVFVDRDNFVAMVKEQYEREISQQVRQKLLWLDAAKDEYRVTLRWALRVQRNMFNPFADNFTWKKLAGALAAGGLPVLVNLQQAPACSGDGSSECGLGANSRVGVCSSRSRRRTLIRTQELPLGISAGIYPQPLSSRTHSRRRNESAHGLGSGSNLPAAGQAKAPGVSVW
jgi:hypothetical protein